MNENEPTKPRPFRRCLDTWPEGLGSHDDIPVKVPPIKVPDAWLFTVPPLPYPWNGEFLKWQEELKTRAGMDLPGRPARDVRMDGE
jgi:hypothetical protein